MKNLYRSFFLLLIFPFTVYATQFHVSPTVNSGGNGSAGSPWSLQTALNQPASVQPGDTIWLHGGTYVNPTNGQDKVGWNSVLKGTAAKPIIVRSFGGDRVILDGGNTQQNGILRISGNYTWYWGFEVMSSDQYRGGTGGVGGGSNPPYPDIRFGTGIDISSSGTPTGNKFISLVVHDCYIGFGSTNANDDSEVNGCILFNNGWKGSDRPHGHNIYVHNGLGKKKPVTDCITWGAFESNVQAWSGSDADMDDFVFDGHVAFFSGNFVDGYNFLLGASTYRNPTVTNGMFYVRGHTNWDLGYGSGTAVGGNISGNYVAGGTQKLAGFSGTTVSNNFVWYESFEGSTPAGTGNTWTTTRPTVNKVFVRKSLYETGRANIVVFNWSGTTSVTVDLSAIYNLNDLYYIVDAQSPSVVIQKGKYTGPVTIPMTKTGIAQPIGNSGQTRTHTPSEFGCFVAIGGTPGGGLSSAAGENVPADFALEQNYPNPFNPSTRIDFVLPASGYATLKVFNALGAEVATLLSGELPAGRHSTEWRPGAIASGVYFYRLTSGSSSVTRRMMLLK
jgi:hypothetical protein